MKSSNLGSMRGLLYIDILDLKIDPILVGKYPNPINFLGSYILNLKSKWNNRILWKWCTTNHNHNVSYKAIVAKDVWKYVVLEIKLFKKIK